MMHCNQDEANRVRDMADRKFAMQDFVGAKACLIEVQQLFPHLEGTTEMLAFLDARIAAHGMTETDWRDIQEAVVRAEAAFKSIGEAFGVLSDKAKKYLLSSKRDEVPEMASLPYESVSPAPAQAPHDALTFWTTCPVCRTQVLRAKRGYRQLCEKCHKVFLATDMNAHSTNGADAFPASSVPYVSGYESQTCAQIGGVASGDIAENPHTYVHSAGLGCTAGADVTLSLPEAARLWAQRDRVNAERESQRKVDEEKLQLQLQPGEREALRKEREKVRALEETVQQLTKMQQEETCGKAVLKVVDGREMQRKKRNRDAYDERDRFKDPVQEYCAESFRSTLEAKLGIRPRDSTQIPGAMKNGEPRLCPQELELVLPDSGFHNFHVQSTEHVIKKNQIWAIFDETDGMPRYYCRVKEVNRDPFTVDATRLDPIHPFRDTFTWLKRRDLSISCGKFNIGDEVNLTSINSFSHLMTPYIYKNGYEIYPMNLEVWAIYRDYDKELPISNARRTLQIQYDYVLIRTAFSAVSGGGRVVRLEKLAGYRTLWVPKGDAFPLTVKYDLHKFSHRVLALPVTKEDVQGVPAGCLELDPSSAPVVDAIEPK